MTWRVTCAGTSEKQAIQRFQKAKERPSADTVAGDLVETTSIIYLCYLNLVFMSSYYFKFSVHILFIYQWIFTYLFWNFKFVAFIYPYLYITMLLLIFKIYILYICIRSLFKLHCISVILNIMMSKWMQINNESYGQHNPSRPNTSLIRYPL